MRILRARSRVAIATTAVAGAVDRAVVRVRKAIGTVVRAVMIATSAVAAVRRDRVEGGENRAASEARAGSATTVDFATSVRRSRRHRACRW